jgi:hypothetical protein
MLFHLFCEFPDGSAKYLHLNSTSETAAHGEAILVHNASIVLFIISSIDPACRLLELECHYTRQEVAVHEKLNS